MAAPNGSAPTPGVGALVGPDDRVARAQAGAPWWMYERPPANRVAPPPALVADRPPDDLDEGPARPAGPGTTPYGPNGQGLAVVAIALVVLLVPATRVAGVDHAGVVVFPLAGMLLAMSFARRCARVRPDEPWLPRLIVWGTLFKLAASAARYVSFALYYKNAGDAFIYDREARKLVLFWQGDLATSPLQGMPIGGSNFIRYLTGVIYYVFGQDLLAAFFLLGLVAVVGSYCWYRALVDAVPYADKRLCLLFMLFAPSIVFWPAALGKEALMQLGVGAMAWATSLALQGRAGRAVPLVLGAGWLLYMVRPHLLALVTVAAAVPYFVGRMRKPEPGAVSGRSVGMLVLGVLVVFTVAAGAKFVGLESMSLDSVEEQLQEQTRSTSYGGSTYSTGQLSITNPLFLPVSFVTVVFRPFIFEARGALPMLAAMEGAVLLWLTFHRFASIRLALRRCRQEPFILYCIMLLVFYAATFSSLANFGLLTRQRSLVLPALYALLALDPVRARRWIEHTKPKEWRPGTLVATGTPDGSAGRDGATVASGSGTNGRHGTNGHGANGTTSNGSSPPADPGTLRREGRRPPRDDL